MSSAIFRDQVEENDRREALLLGLAFAFLCLTSLALYLAPAVKTRTAEALGSRWQHFSVLPVWLIAAVALRRTLQRLRPLRDPFILPVGLLLSGWGVLTIWRLAPGFGMRQMGWFVLGVGAMLIVFRLPADLSWLRRYRYLWLIVGVSLTALTLLLGTNPSSVEPRLWLGCCGVYLQPSEPLRLLLISFFASYLADRMAFRWGERSKFWLIAYAPLVVVWGLSVALLVMQGDIGAGTLYLVILTALLYLVTGRRQILIAAFLIILAGGLIGFGFSASVQNRIQAWIDPWSDPSGGSYQLVQALIAVASGGVLGRGPGIGSPAFVPVVHSDFVFTAIVEEWGLLGGLGLIALFAILVARGFRVAARSKEPFSVILAGGLSIGFAFQTILIVGGNIRMLPLVGVTLPFVSYGGSSLMTNLIALSFLLLLSGSSGGAGNFSRPLLTIHGWITAAWMGLAVLLGWWTIYRAPLLTARTDNPRRTVSELYNLRGKIVDRTGEVLAMSTGEQGSYERVYPAPWAATVTGFSSLAYGQTGVERTMDKVLRGEEGYPLSVGWWDRLLTGYPPPGLDVRLTVDSALQREAWEALQGETGAIVILDPSTGDILAMVSSPSYDPNRVDADWQSLIDQEGAPLLNRATQARYQPGMTFAPFVMAWSETAGLVRLEDRASNAASAVSVDGTELRCLMDLSNNEEVDYAQALRAGCPGAFTELGADFEAKNLVGMLQAFGFTQPPSIRLETVPVPPAVVGPSESDWQMAAVGQGDITVTPLQVARAFAAVLADGDLPALRVVAATKDMNGRWQEVDSLAGRDEAIAPEISERIRTALTDDSGSIFRYTAQAIAGTAEESLSWFVCSNVDDLGFAQLVLVILEDAPLVRAQAIGLSLLAWHDPSSSPP